MNEVFKSTDQARSLLLPKLGSQLQKTDEMPWQDCGAPGFWAKPLVEDATAGVRTWLMKVDAGAFSDMHAHSEYEQIYVLAGSFYDQDGCYGPGDFIVRAPGAMHTAGSDDGATVLLFYSAATDESG